MEKAPQEKGSYIPTSLAPTLSPVNLSPNKTASRGGLGQGTQCSPPTREAEAPVLLQHPLYPVQGARGGSPRPSPPEAGGGG